MHITDLPIHLRRGAVALIGVMLLTACAAAAPTAGPATAPPATATAAPATATAAPATATVAPATATAAPATASAAPATATTAPATATTTPSEPASSPTAEPTPVPPTLVPGSIEYLGNATSLPAIVGDHEGFFAKHGVKVHVTTVGFGEQDSLFATGNYPITAQAPWDVAKSIAAGDNLKFVSTTAGLPALSLLLIRTADKDKYKSYKDLKGKKIGIPGFGTATWGAFATILKSLDGIDATTFFEPVEADSSTLVALLDQGQIDAALPFAALAVLAQSQPDKYTVIFNMQDYWVQKTGQPLLLVGFTARGDWLDKNAASVPGLIAGFDDAAKFIAANADMFATDPYYGPIMQAAGIGDPAQAAAYAKLLKDGYYYDSSWYTQAWIDNQYGFISDSVGTLIDSAPPPKDQIFYQPTVVAPSASPSH